jgi:hypothetical protein
MQARSAAGGEHHGQGIPRALRWRKLVETGAYGTIPELRAVENINASSSIEYCD